MPVCTSTCPISFGRTEGRSYCLSFHPFYEHVERQVVIMTLIKATVLHPIKGDPNTHENQAGSFPFPCSPTTQIVDAVSKHNG